ncbi:MAG: DHHA1 domain-containing protein [Minisyncoccia bacterium]
MDNSILVFYHVRDNDGLGSAWVAWNKFKDKADYFGIDYHNDYNFDYHNKTIYFVDIRPDDEVVQLLKQNHNYLVLIDHHISSKDKLNLFDENKFSLKHSAAVLSWQYFFPKKKLPKLLNYIEDIDIWKLKVRNSREVNNALDFYGEDFRRWNKIAKDLEDSKKRKEYIRVGKIISQYQDKIIQKIAAKAKLVEFEGKKILAVNSPILVSEIGNTLVQKRPPLAIVWSETNQKLWFSLRSNGLCDVSKIAEKYGGGGQKGAAAFALNNSDPLPWKNL